MGHITLSLLGVICFISATYCTGCFSGPGHRFPITCPGALDSTKTYCCEISGSYRCCDAEEFARQEGYNDDSASLILRRKRDVEVDVAAGAAGLGVAAIIGIILAALFPFILCCCCCCACCPCYSCCHPGNATNVTIVQPSGSANPGNVQNNFSVNMPAQPAMQQQYSPIPAQQPPPQYTQGDYNKQSSPGLVH